MRGDQHGWNAVHGDVAAHAQFESAEASELMREAAGGGDDGLNWQRVVDTRPS